MNYRKDALKLAKKYGAKIKFHPKEKTNEIYLIREYNKDDDLIGYIHCKQIKTAEDFAGILHELAHWVYESEDFLDRIYKKFDYAYIKNNVSKFTLKIEFNAWKHATYLYPNWTYDMKKEFLSSIKSYIRGWEYTWKRKLDKKFVARITNLNKPAFKIYS